MFTGMKSTPNNTQTEVNAVPVVREYDAVYFESYSDTACEVHACGCKHREKMFGHKIRRKFKGGTMAELIRSVALDYNSDFAGDNGMSPEEYVDGGNGYHVGTEKNDVVRIMPCVKFGEVK